MRLTVILHKFKNTKYRRIVNLWRDYKFRYTPAVIPQALLDKGVKVVKTRDYINEPSKVSRSTHPIVPDVQGEVKKSKCEASVTADVETEEDFREEAETRKEDHPDYKEEKVPRKEDHPDYKEETNHLYLHQIQFIEGRKQACLLTKTQEMAGIPPAVDRLIDRVEIPEMDRLIQGYIMNSQVWDPTNVRLPKRIDKSKIGYKFPVQYGIPTEKSMMMLLQDLLRLSLSISNQYPSSLQNRSLVLEPYLNSHYRYRGKLISVRGNSQFLLSSKFPLMPFAERDQVLATIDHDLGDLHPVCPTIDLQRENIYKLQNIAAYVKPTEFAYPHTLFHLNKDFSKAEHRQNRSLMFMMGYAAAVARQQYGDNVKDLESPICLQCVNMDQTTLNFSFFQLNTLDLTSNNGIKNQVWFDSDNTLFKKWLSQPWLGREHRNSKYDNFQSYPLKKMLAVILNGITELEHEERGKESA